MHGVSVSYSAEYELDYTYGDPAVVNDPELYSLVKEKAAKLFGKEKIVEMKQQLGSEDFSYYTNCIPGMITRMKICRL